MERRRSIDKKVRPTGHMDLISAVGLVGKHLFGTEWTQNPAHKLLPSYWSKTAREYRRYYYPVKGTKAKYETVDVPKELRDNLRALKRKEIAAREVLRSLIQRGK